MLNVFHLFVAFEWNFCCVCALKRKLEALEHPKSDKRDDSCSRSPARLTSEVASVVNSRANTSRSSSEVDIHPFAIALLLVRVPCQMRGEEGEVDCTPPSQDTLPFLEVCCFSSVPLLPLNCLLIYVLIHVAQNQSPRDPSPTCATTRVPTRPTDARTRSLW